MKSRKITDLVLFVGIAVSMLTGCASGRQITAVSDKSGLYGFTDVMVEQNINPAAYAATFWRIDCENPDSKQPRSFRTSYDVPSPDKAKSGMDGSYVPSIKGLSDTRMSGSAEFDESQLDSLIAGIRKYHEGRICIVDLRQESHIFVNGLSLSRYGLRDWGNLGRNLEEISQIERAQGKQISGKTIDAYLLDDDKQPQIQELIAVREIRSEQEIAASHGLEYYRLPCTDHISPTKEEIDEFIRFVNNLDEDIWLHFHCEAGKGRTTIFMAFYDMMRNPDVSLKDIVYRQCELGGNYVLTESGDDWRNPYYAEKASTMRLFYQYVQENHGTGFATPFSEWLSHR